MALPRGELMKKTLGCISMIMIMVISGCATNESQLRETLKKNPNIIFDVIEKNPQQFIEVVNRAAQIAQRQRYEKLDAAMKEERDKELKNPKRPQLSEDRRLSGSANAKITIVEYADFQCPACGAVFHPLKALKDRYKDKVQFYYKHMPLDMHPLAYPAARYFEAIRLQDKRKALQFYDLVFENQRQMSDESFFEKMAKKTRVNMKRLQQDLASEKIEQIIQEDMAEFKSFGYTGTPIILINGVSLQGAYPLEEMERVIQLTGGL